MTGSSKPASGEPPAAEAALIAEIARLQRVVGGACNPRLRDAAMIQLREREERLRQIKSGRA